MDTIIRNLARKLRSQNFNQIIGQELTIKILKNSLYKAHYFPVYLFAGQRGCGKTTTARVFAAALNCEQLVQFQKNPKKLVPCLSCISCVAMKSGRHPDFIEIDAASHTGVDSVRQIIESASLLPLMGHKKVYLIDEAHMLSKAAFNALLKILEEPPSSVLFILATTIPLKIIDTVRSRCFQLFFKSVRTETLLKYLKKVCSQEKIRYDVPALELIIDQAEGSVRDALNLLEQVRFLGNEVSKKIVLQTLGYVDDNQLLSILTAILQQQPQQVLHVLKMLQQGSYSAEFIWYRLIELLRLLLWIKYGVEPARITDGLKLLAKKSSLQELHHILEILYNHESIFVKTTAQHALLETVLLQLCRQYKKDNDSSGSSSLPQQQIVASQGEVLQENINSDSHYDGEDSDEEEEEDEYVEQWAVFVQDLEKLGNSLVTSIFKQGNLLKLDKNSGCLTVEFYKELIFFKDWLEETRSLWLPLLQKTFVKKIKLNPVFTGTKKIEISHSKPQGRNDNTQVRPAEKYSLKTFSSAGKYRRRSQNESSAKKLEEPTIDISNKNVWKKAQLILRYFPSTVTEIRK